MAAKEIKQTAKLYCFRALHFAKHLLTAFNTKGEGIHSPYLFYWVRYYMYDHNRYYIWQHIEQQRQVLLNNHHSLSVTDFGTGANRPSERTISSIASTSLQSKKYAQLLFRLVQYVGGNHTPSPKKHTPLNIIELGTNLGITTAYLAAAHSLNHITTFEGSQSLIDVAQSVWKNLNLNNISVVQGNIDLTLHTSLHSPIDIAYIDANHTYEALIAYFNMLLPYTSRKSVFVIDDIHSTPDMQKAWNEIKNHNKVTTTMDLYQIGLVFFDTDYLHKHYRLLL